MKKYLLLVLILAGLGTAVWGFGDKNQIPDVSGTAAVEIIKPAPPYVQINDIKIPVDLAQTEAEVQKGLSGLASLEAEKGMLFIFSKPDYYRFWMPDMNFPIDIIWLSQNTIAGIHKNVSNRFDSKNPKFYTPPQPVSRVLEVNAGFADFNNIKTGDPVSYFLDHD
ncbi:MAG: DUF192 domain-containing protein [Candidatus Colwellbacteria bacterium]|nr:DUF192 domain-containing protein [Candidatus Colwellbacteria bacterium]